MPNSTYAPNPDRLAREKGRHFTAVPVIDLAPAIGPDATPSSRQAVLMKSVLPVKK